jgi:hypothetical protein
METTHHNEGVIVMIKLFRTCVFMLLAAAMVAGCGSDKKGRSSGRSDVRSDVQEAAMKTYVAPGDLDEFYLFKSGGHSGQIYIYGVPSMRHLATIPVYSPYPATGYGFDKESKAMLGGFTWGDAHHPSLSETDGDYDGRWLFINDNANNRVARIDLHDFKTGPDSERHGQSRFDVRHREHGIPSLGQPVLGADSEGDLRKDRRLRDEVQRDCLRRRGRSAVGNPFGGLGSDASSF